MSQARSPVALHFATPSQLLLLRAALLEGPAAEEAAQEWFASVQEAAGPGFLRLEQGARRLLPLVYRNVKEAIPSELRDILRRVYLQYWADNQKLFRRLEERLAWFQAGGIPTMVLKGAALSVLHYRDKGIRPMSDFDILIPVDLARQVVGRLQRDGWSPVTYHPRVSQNAYFYRHIHGMSLTHREHGDLDLHWHVLHAATFRGADRAFWDHSVPLTLNTIVTRALNPTDQLLHGCVHGFAANHVVPIRWIADALTILRTSQVDWSRLVELARHLSVSIPLTATLSFLRDTFPTPIPGDVLGQLAAIRVDASERRYFSRLSKFDRSASEIFAENWERHRRASRDMPPLLRLASLPQQFQLHYNLPQLTDLGPFAFSLLGKRIARMVGHR
jgi:hypothetical protein